jgi:hypothetical protein
MRLGPCLDSKKFLISPVVTANDGRVAPMLRLCAKVKICDSVAEKRLSYRQLIDRILQKGMNVIRD